MWLRMMRIWMKDREPVSHGWWLIGRKGAEKTL